MRLEHSINWEIAESACLRFRNFFAIDGYSCSLNFWRAICYHVHAYSRSPAFE